MTLHWIKEDDPRWDAAKQRLFGPAELAAAGLDPPRPGAAVADEWWRVTGDDGQVAGYGWLDSEWGDAQITFWVDPARRGEGTGSATSTTTTSSTPSAGPSPATPTPPCTSPTPAAGSPSTAHSQTVITKQGR